MQNHSVQFLQGPQKNIYRRTPSISTFTSICIFKKYILGDRTAVICVDVPLGLRKYDSCSQCWSPRSLRDSSVWIPQFLQCLKCGNQTMLVMCVFKRVSCHLCALCSWGTKGAYICLYQYLDNILFGLHDSRNERSCGAAVICAIFVYILCFWCAFPTRYPLSCLICLRISYIIYSSHSHPDRKSVV